MIIKCFAYWLEDLLLISGGDIFDSQVFYVWSMQIRRGDLYEGQGSSKHSLLPYK